QVSLRRLVGVRDSGSQIDLRIRRERLQGVAIAPELRDALVPCLRRRRLRARGPVLVRPLHLFVVRVLREVENVVLRDAEVSEELPCRVRQPPYPASAELGREARDRLIEIGVCLAPVERSGDLVPHDSVIPSFGLTETEVQTEALARLGRRMQERVLERQLPDAELHRGTATAAVGVARHGNALDAERAVWRVG